MLIPLDVVLLVIVAFCLVAIYLLNRKVSSLQCGLHQLDDARRVGDERLEARVTQEIRDIWASCERCEDPK